MRVVGEWCEGGVVYVAVGLVVAAYGLELECEVLERNPTQAQVASRVSRAAQAPKSAIRISLL